eukprot:1161601-Pelagomonas_calceolata.AAC.16
MKGWCLAYPCYRAHNSGSHLWWTMMHPECTTWNGGGTRHFISTMPLYGGMTVFTFITCMLSSGVGATVKPNVLRVSGGSFNTLQFVLTLRPVCCHLEWIPLWSPRSSAE